MTEAPAMQKIIVMIEACQDIGDLKMGDTFEVPVVWKAGPVAMIPYERVLKKASLDAAEHLLDKASYQDVYDYEPARFEVAKFLRLIDVQFDRPPESKRERWAVEGTHHSLGGIWKGEVWAADADEAELKMRFAIACACQGGTGPRYGDPHSRVDQFSFCMTEAVKASVHLEQIGKSTIIERLACLARGALATGMHIEGLNDAVATLEQLGVEIEAAPAPKM